MPDEPRPAAHFVHGPGVLVPDGVCRILEHDAGLSEFRSRVRGRRPQLDAVLDAIHTAAIRHRRISDLGNQPLPTSEVAAQSGVTTEQAAQALNVSTRRVTQLISANELSADYRDGRWVVDTNSLTALIEKRTP
ncbi:MAG: hypothetical protein DI573_13980 [Microbacterium sp.]|uniref:helix-turn-helix domain-containing protein n=1 Tax=Microbacterium sp. TaxID=51671 RepID=UPI000DAF8CCD|nr:helix-turn-helix domain-containing protein [Microbacterium sp.]PZU36281.1 MAG: hypothetical protein DI573_13980 [Microbacterium sp.]